MWVQWVSVGDVGGSTRLSDRLPDFLTDFPTSQQSDAFATMIRGDVVMATSSW